ncbi:hypothetical protein [Sutcliffiella horikoshii]|nr:hypothetical protein [Sutcliffiella horikoshii]
MERIIRVVTMPLVVVHLLIAYFWIFDWEKLTTGVGLISWIGSIILGLVVFVIDRKSTTSDQRLFRKGIVTATTFMTILLGVFALMIEFITSSMP